MKVMRLNIKDVVFGWFLIEYLLKKKKKEAKMTICLFTFYMAS